MPMGTDGLKALPRDEHKIKASRGSNSVVFLNETDSGVTTGSFQEILLPANTECKSIMIQVHNGVVDDFTSYGANPAGFHFSTTGNNSSRDYTCHVGSHTIDIGKKKDASIGYVRVAASQYGAPCTDAGSWVSGVGGNQSGETDRYGNKVYGIPNIGIDQRTGCPVDTVKIRDIGVGIR